MLSKTDQLKDRVNARKHELLSKFDALKADSRATANEARTKVLAKLNELDAYLKEGWERISESTAAKLDKWLQSDKD